MTNQALFLQDLAKLSGIPMRSKWGRKSFRVTTESKRVPIRDWETGKITGHYRQFGDAYLVTDPMPIATALEVAEKMASACASVTVYESKDGTEARLTASTEARYMERGTLTHYRYVDGEISWRNAEIRKVPFDQDLHDRAWARANER